MKFGQRAGLLVLALALLVGLGAWWSWQHGFGNSLVIFLAVWLGMLGLALLLFPGASPEDFPPTPAGTAPQTVNWLSASPVAHKCAWVVAGLLALYLSSWLNDYLRGQVFFTLGTQLKTVGWLALVLFMLRSAARRQGR